MATTKKSPKAKTNTAKSKAAAKKAPAKKAISAKKVTTKSVSTKAKKPAAKVSKTKVVNKPSAFRRAVKSPKLPQRLTQAHVFVSVAGAIAAVVLMATASVQIFTGLVVPDELASKSGTVFVPAIHHLYDLEVRWVLVVILLVSAIVPVVNLYKVKRYKQALKTRSNPLRWASTGIVSGAMLGVVAGLSGVQDFMTLKLVGGLIVVTAALGWLSERQNADPKAKPDYSAYGISLFTGALPWLIILAFAFGTPLWGMIRYPWYVYALYASVFITSALYAFNGYNYVRRFRNWTNYEVLERNYLIIDIVGRLSFAIILIVGLSK